MQIRSLLNSYITTNNLVNPNDQAYINLDELLYSCVSAKLKGKAKGKDIEPQPEISRFMKRDELLKEIVGKMQSWYTIRAERKDPVTKSEQVYIWPPCFICSQHIQLQERESLSNPSRDQSSTRSEGVHLDIRV
jgi:hypothetical protein